MKLFFNLSILKRIATIIGAAIIIFILFLIITTLNARSFQVDETVKEILVGDSHIRYAFDDNLDINTLNMGSSSESTYFTYFKLKHILKSNPNITSVFLGFSYHNISAYYDQYTFGKYSRDVASNYFFILPVEEQLQLFKWNLRRAPYFIASLIKSGINNWMNKETFRGGFDNPYNSVSAKESIMNNRLNFQYYTNGNLNSFSNLNLLYFEYIVSLCQHENVDLIILNTPLHPYYQAKIPEEFFNKYNSIVSSKNIQVMDLSQMDFPDNFYQPDGDLLSKEGALESTLKIISAKLSHDERTYP